MFPNTVGPVITQRMHHLEYLFSYFKSDIIYIQCKESFSLCNCSYCILTFNRCTCQRLLCNDLICDTWRPRLRWIPQQSSHNKIALFIDAHPGSETNGDKPIFLIKRALLTKNLQYINKNVSLSLIVLVRHHRTEIVFN